MMLCAVLRIGDRSVFGHMRALTSMNGNTLALAINLDGMRRSADLDLFADEAMGNRVENLIGCA